MKTIEEKQKFYETCASILEIEHKFHPPVRKRTRWNTRNLGNGRFPGFGLIQCFGSFVRIIDRTGTKSFKSYQEVYDYLKKLS